MGERIRHTGNVLKGRWHQKMPRFFYWLVVIACGIGGTAFAVHSGVLALGGTHAEWWEEAYRYIIGGCIATVFVCKFTVAGGYKDINPDRLQKDGNVIREKGGDSDEKNDD